MVMGRLTFNTRPRASASFLKTLMSLSIPYINGMEFACRVIRFLEPRFPYIATLGIFLLTEAGTRTPLSFLDRTIPLPLVA